MHDRTRAALRLGSRAVAPGAHKAELLQVSVPSHCPLLQAIAKSLREQLRSMQIRDPQFGHVSNVKARAIRSAVGMATDLAGNIAHGVRWHDATRVAQELGCPLFLEMPPGHALSDLVRENVYSSSVFSRQLDMCRSGKRRWSGPCFLRSPNSRSCLGGLCCSWIFRAV